jgi:hypothetical protein
MYRNNFRRLRLLSPLQRHGGQHKKRQQRQTELRVLRAGPAILKLPGYIRLHPGRIMYGKLHADQ